ncbi:hypothetical protein DDB_G0282641 [Dictyostelium discoideum AX4]|uniref:Uncharacterized protein n=2 Tax=Dictyostelium discoideum TaxID=44689 RepID=Q54S68_DICDI|nr:hypothetical protein DDB_G0282641 [Dictyostelium discoideum AX4]EAL66180.1 hypothetical protein DDB_G0282641 [Dictyostelium discoideum AX4]|eukprot:XP_640171.1 hypothetical protein DDB_G0282641 [Dictyostelium discoideum AX4]
MEENKSIITTTVKSDKPIGSYENGEYLFWKVFNNKYLLNFIIYKIQTSEWEYYQDHYQIHAENRWKFKDVFSFDWLIINQQFPLLKNKIENNDFILFDKKSIHILFKEFSILSGTKKVLPKLANSYDENGDYGNAEDGQDDDEDDDDDEDAKNENNEYKRKDEKKALILKEILISLLEKKRNQFEICDLTKLAVINNSIEGIKILINEPYCINVYPSTIELAFEKCDCEMIKTLLLNENKNNNILINNEIKKKSLKLASKNTFHSTYIIQFLLDNPNLYIPPPPISLPQLQNPSPVEPGLPELNDNDDDDDDDDDEDDKNKNKTKTRECYILYDYLILISSLQTKKKLLDLDIVLKNPQGLKENFNITDSIDDLLIKLEINLKYFHDYYDGIPKSILKKINQILNNQSISKEKQLKKIQRLVILVSGDYTFYSGYILKYEESINEFHNDSYYSNDDDGDDNDDDDDDDGESKLITFSRLILLNVFSYQSHTTMDKLMKNFKEKKIKWHKPLFKLIGSEKKTITIDKSTYDWIIGTDCDEVFDYFNSKQFDFQSFETAIYCFENYNNSRKYLKPFSIKTLYFNSIKECNLDQLKTIESLYIDPFDLFSDQRSYKCIPLPTSKDDLIKLINYFSDSNFKAFSKDSLVSFFSQVFKTGLVSPSEIKIKIPTTITLPNDILLDALFDLDLKFLELLLVSLDGFEFEQEEYERLDSVEKNLFSKELNLFHNDIELIDFDELYRLIEFIINKFLKTGSKRGRRSESACEIMNYLYQMLLQRELVTPKQVIKVNQLLQSHSVPIKHSLFNAFYYLQIRSAKFTKYILSRPGFDSFFEINYEESYSCSIDYSEGVNHLGQHGFDLAIYLDFDCFTFDYVLGTNENGDYNTPFDQVLYQLVYQLSHSIINEIDIIDDFTSLSMNADLEYCLDIRRVDLFFKQLEFINKQIQQTNLDGYEYQDENPTFPIQESILNSPSDNLLPTSELFLNREQPPIPPIPQSKTFNSEIPFPLARHYNTLKISNSVLDLALIIMDVDEIQKLIEWNWYRTDFLFSIFSKSMFWSKFDVSQHLFTNYKIQILSLPQHSMTSHYSYLLEFNYLINNHFERVKNPNLFKIDTLKSDSLNFPTVLSAYLVDYLSRCDIGEYEKFMDIKTREELLNILIFIIYAEYCINMELDTDTNLSLDRKKLLFPLIESKECQEIIQRAYDKFKIKNDETIISQTEQQIKDYSTQVDNMFTLGFINGDIIICQLILKHYPNLFKITQYALAMAIKADRIHIIKFYYHNNNDNLIMNLKDDQSLVDYLKSELLNHQDYKFDINWLN